MTNPRIQCCAVLWFTKDGNWYNLTNIPEDCALDVIDTMYNCGYTFVKTGSSSIEYCVRLQKGNHDKSSQDSQSEN